MGLRSVMYINDILIVAETESLAREHRTSLVYLLKNLAFVFNFSKSQNIPTQEIEFLGFLGNSKTMELKLPGRKSGGKHTDSRDRVRSVQETYHGSWGNSTLSELGN